MSSDGPKAIIVDAMTSEVVERDLTTEEITEQASSQAEFMAEQKAIQAARQSALAKLAALGLTEAEIAAL
jgi:hypothetical protein